MATTLRGEIITPQATVTGSLSFSEHIESISLHPAKDVYILPGFIDTHVHGGAGSDTMDGPDGVCKLARFHLEHGTTTLYPTTLTSPWEELLQVLRSLKPLITEPKASPNLPSLPGIHLEGPFISPQNLGAQPDFAQIPTKTKIEALLQLDVFKLITLAPEIPGALKAAKRFANAGIRVSIGHSLASYEQVTAFIAELRKTSTPIGFTHLYNAMGGLMGRKPGVVGAALADKESFSELIFDTHHVHVGSFLAAFHAKPKRLHLVTDAIRACGMPEGPSELGGQDIFVKDGKASLVDGKLAGSVLTLDQAVRNVLETGLSLPQVSYLLSGVPAQYMGLSDRGIIAIGKRADIVVMDKAFNILEVYVAGRKLYG